MKIWYSKTEELCSFYYYPFTWNRLLALFDRYDLCSIEHFIGVTEGQSYYKTCYDCSPELLPMKEPIKVYELKILVKAFVKWQYEYKFLIGDVEIERAITGGIVFTSDEKRLNLLIEKLNVPRELLSSSYRNRLVSMGRNGKMKMEGEFAKKEDLFDHVYDELMRKVSPNYYKFMDALASATLE